ncbi:DNA polymerase III subunit delta' [Aureimonas sp. SA4125]|uniref:DNA polymerase III subunit delta' n=1 Tax=Aureimonas sp. SA4125 TaxID=2826993 RepID=UPI001CC79CDE|nr:DNA polymerase III subunit delta' [Aureimonas sp. SA4125]BDA84626.1 DNA polymerase III subunit delta' [Aureimonas sp. SA4125]
MSESTVEAREDHDSLPDVPSPAARSRLFGHATQWAALVGAHQSGKLHHAWLLQGPRGIGKATAAFAFARYLLSPKLSPGSAEPVADPESPVARQIAGGGHPGLVHITRPAAERGGGFKTQITVEEIRKLNRFFRTTTGGGQWRIALIDPADDMNRNAANALLKILEEPPERSIFLITNHLPGRLLPTIRSRCRVLRFDGLGEADMAAALHSMPTTFGEAEITGAIGLAGGSVRTAVSLIANGGLEIEAKIRELYTADEPDWQAIQGLADVLTQKGRESAFELMLDAVFKWIAHEAEARLAGADGAHAGRFAALWMAESQRLREGLAYNLDRKQMLVSLFHAVFSLRAAVA